MRLEIPGPLSEVTEPDGRRISVPWHNAIRRLRDAIQGVRDIGEYREAASPEARDGELKPDGSAVSRAAYPALFSAIGTLYGAGDGSTTFNLPTRADAPPVYYFMRAR